MHKYYRYIISSFSFSFLVLPLTPIQFLKFIASSSIAIIVYYYEHVFKADHLGLNNLL